MTGTGGQAVLVTRPRKDAAPLIAALAQRGIATVAAPMLDIVRRDRPLRGELTDVQGVLFTSANGVRAFAANSDRRDLPVWCVGDATARCAAAQGFDAVCSAGGDVDALARRVVGACAPEDGVLLHPAAGAVAGDLARRLEAAGFRYRRIVLYDARTADGLPETAARALAEGRIGYVLFFSPRSAATFVRLTARAHLTDRLPAVRALCLSPAVAARLAGTPWRSVDVAAKPTREALMTAMDRARDADMAGRAR